jgi:[protein-PII] uridylyltransferase
MHNVLQSGRKTLKSLWLQGISGRSLLQKHTSLVDGFLAQCFQGVAVDADSIALVALGGYGRSELFPFSDIDLLLLYEPVSAEMLESLAAAVFYPLWDAGLEVGHSARTIEACLDDAESDFFFQVALLDARLIVGSERLFADLRQRYKARYVDGQRLRFFEKMQLYREKRYEQFGGHGYLLEPNIKEGRGGARDLQAYFWTARVVLGLGGLDGLEEAGLLNSQERGELAEAWEQLVRIRNRLHYSSNRKNDRMYFEHQEEIAQAFGYKKAAGLLDVEHFMREVYSHMQTVAVATDLFFEHVREVLSQGASREANRDLEPFIEIRQHRIYCKEAARFGDKPTLMMRLFVQSAKTGLPIHYRTKKAIRDHLFLVNDKLRRSKRMGKLFFDVLLHDSPDLQGLNGLLETGMLAAYLPEFAAMESLAQHDVYHVYTVDYHLLQTVAQLHKLKQEEQHIFEAVSQPDLLFLAGLLHDIGKGGEGSHAERGATIVEEIGSRLDLSRKDRALLVFLVQHHLFLAKTALRRDLEDEELIMGCAEIIQSSERLAMLFLLTIADARATGPNVWNDWKNALLFELYLKVALLLERKDMQAPSYRQGADWMLGKVDQLLGGSDAFDLSILPTDYLVSFTPEMVVDHLKLQRRLGKEEVLLEPSEEQGHWSLMIVAHDQPGLLAKICGVLALHNMKVLAAQIFTWLDGTVVDQMIVSSMVDEYYSDKDWTAVRNDLLLAFGNRLGLNYRLHRKLPLLNRTPRSDWTKAKIVLDNTSSAEHTIIEVFGPDRPGLLFEITKVLADFDINIFRARIINEAERVIDVFYVRTSGGEKIHDPKLQEEIRQSLLFAVSAGIVK